MYDAESRVLWVEFPEANGDTLLGHRHTSPYTDALGAGQWEGQPLTVVRFVFHDAAAAAYNVDSLAFVGIEAWMAGPPRTKYGEAPDFEVREDGIPG